MESPEPRKVPLRGRPRFLFAWLFVGSTVGGYGTFLLSLVSLLVADTLALSEATLGLAFAALSVGGIASPFLGGALGDRLGPRPVSLAALGLLVLGGFLAGSSPTAATLAAGEFLLGAGLAMFGVMAYAWINESLSDRKGFYLGIYLSSLVAGLMCAGLSVAFLLPHVPSWRTFFLATSLLALVPSVPLWFLLPKRLQVKPREKSIRAAFGNRDVRWVCGQQLLIGLGSAGYSWLPWFLVLERGLDLRFAALAFVGSAALWAVGGVAFGRLADAGWIRPIIAFGNLGTALAYLTFLMWSEVSGTILLLFLYAFLWPAGAQVPITFLGHRLGAKAQRTEMGLLENLFLLGDAVGVAIIGFVAVAWDLLWALALVPGGATLLASGLFASVFGIGRGAGSPAHAQTARPD